MNPFALKPIFFGYLFFLLILSARPSLVLGSDCYRVHQAVQTLQRFHYKPLTFSKEHEDRIFDRFITRLDRKHLLFTQDVLVALEPYRPGILDTNSNAPCELLELTNDLYQTSLQQQLEIIEEILAKPFTHREGDTYQRIKAGAPFLADASELRKAWEHRLRISAMLLVLDDEDPEKPLDPAKAEKKINAPEIRKKLRNRLRCRVNDFLDNPESLQEYIESELLNAIALEYDPHSAHFTPEIQKQFLYSLATDELSFGLHLGVDEEGDIMVQHVIPGSPAWHSYSLHEGDEIVAIQLGENNSINMNCATVESLESLESKLQRSSENIAHFTVKKQSGQTEVVTLKKMKLESEENVIRSFVLEGENKVGYMALPGFYTSLAGDEVDGCANDLAKELIKLKKENIQGLILDLRYNGGGSLEEAMQLAGIFIDEGPLAIEVSRGTRPVVLQDRNRGTIYDEPLILLVNGYSASASEILAGVFQDYNRAVIVGSKTYGKGNGQILMPTSGHDPDNQLKMALSSFTSGMLKVTVSQYFQLSKTSHQEVGIIPHVLLPETYSADMAREADEENALSSGSVEKKIYRFAPLAPLPIAELAAKSTARLTDHAEFDKIATANQKLRGLYGQDFLPLDFDRYKAYYDQIDSCFAEINLAFATEAEDFTISSPSYKAELLTMDDFEQEMTELMLDDLRKDLYIEEAYFILRDLLENPK